MKIIFNDDDVTLTRGYIERAFAADYDLCEGVVDPAHALRGGLVRAFPDQPRR